MQDARDIVQIDKYAIVQEEECDILKKVYKALLNIIYGDFVMYPLKPELLYRGENYDTQERDSDFYDKYIKKNTKLYQWAVWCTALARKELQDMISVIPFKDFIYCDTDSV